MENQRKDQNSLKQHHQFQNNVVTSRNAGIIGVAHHFAALSDLNFK